MSERKLRGVVAALAATGVAIAGYLTYARYTHTALACTTGGCETVQQSEYAKLAGVPVAVLGLASYLFILCTAFTTAELARLVAAVVAVAGVAFSAYLLYVQIAVIDAICQWCLASDSVMTLLAGACVLRVVSAARRV